MLAATHLIDKDRLKELRKDAAAAYAAYAYAAYAAYDVAAARRWQINVADWLRASREPLALRSRRALKACGSFVP